MTNTIDLLESIGKDASLRHATAVELEEMLRHMKASEELRIAALRGDASPLTRELGDKLMNVTNNPPHIGAPDDDEEDEDEEEGEADDKKS